MKSFLKALRSYPMPFALAMMTLVAWIYSTRLLSEDIQAEFDRITGETERAIERRMRDYEQVLVQATGLFAVSKDVTRAEFREYVRQMEIDKFYPGIQGIGFAEYVRKKDFRRHERAGLLSGMPHYHIHPEGIREEYLPILYLEPLDRRNREAIGYDMMSEQIRRSAIVRARDSGEPALSGRVVLVQEIDEAVQPGFLLYAPAYRAAATRNTKEERRAAFMGHVYAPFRAHDLFNSLFGGLQNPAVGFRIYSGTNSREKELLYSIPDSFSSDSISKASKRGGLKKTSMLDIAGQNWTIQFQELPALKQQNPSYLPMTILLAGLLLTLSSARLAHNSKLRIEARESALLREQQLRSEIQQIADDNAKLYRDANGAVAARNELLAIVSHDLRNPLNAILLNSKLLMKSALKPQDLEQMATRIQRSGSQMNRLIQDLLDIAQIEAGSLPIEAIPQDTKKLVMEAMDSLLPLAHDQSIELRAECPENFRVLADSKRILQVLSNLIGNALKFTPEGGAIRIQVGRDPSGAALFSVTDTGKGISAEDLPLVFQRFWGKDKYRGGTGLGLFIVRQIIEAHQGRIWVESNRGRGTTFWFTLPTA